jgi:hypothetical protein
VKVEVSNCWSCPLRGYSYLVVTVCLHPRGELREVKVRPRAKMPDWCPLRREPLLVVMTEAAEGDGPP